MSLRKLDAFGKPREDLVDRSALGGFITLLAGLAAGVLFCAQIYVYAAGVTKHSLNLSPSETFPVPRLSEVNSLKSLHASEQPGIGRRTIPLRFHVTFPFIGCNQLDVLVDNARYSSGDLAKIHGRWAVSMRTPTMQELRMAIPEENFVPSSKSCSVTGNFNIPKVGGSLSITMSQSSWSEVTAFLIMGSLNSQNKRGSTATTNRDHNVSHYIHFITFGVPFPLMKHPLKDAWYSIENDSGGLALNNLSLKLIPTKYTSFLSTQDTYQMSLTSHVVQPETLAQMGPFIPGMAMTWDFGALQVNHVEYRDNPLVFISSLVSIVGGCFVTVSLVTGCLVHSAAAAVAKKID